MVMKIKAEIEKKIGVEMEKKRNIIIEIDEDQDGNKDEGWRYFHRRDRERETIYFICFLPFLFTLLLISLIF